jgi:hypothetical protein
MVHPSCKFIAKSCKEFRQMIIAIYVIYNDFMIQPEPVALRSQFSCQHCATKFWRHHQSGAERYIAGPQATNFIHAQQCPVIFQSPVFGQIDANTPDDPVGLIGGEIVTRIIEGVAYPTSLVVGILLWPSHLLNVDFVAEREQGVAVSLSRYKTNVHSHDYPMDASAEAGLGCPAPTDSKAPSTMFANKAPVTSMA